MKRTVRGARRVAARALPTWLAVVAVAWAGDVSYTLPRDRIAAGATVASGPTYRVTATVGQHEAGPVQTGPTYWLRGGYVAAAPAPIVDHLFADGFEP